MNLLLLDMLPALMSAFDPTEALGNILTSGEVSDGYLRVLPPKQVLHAALMNCQYKSPASVFAV